MLREAFAIDPFNVRVSNMLKVLDVLSDYSLIETEHFVVKFDRGQDAPRAKYAAKFLETKVYPSLVKKLGYQPSGKSLFEVFSRARNTDGHGWFSTAWSACRISAQSAPCRSNRGHAISERRARRNSIGLGCCGTSLCMSSIYSRQISTFHIGSPSAGRPKRRLSSSARWERVAR